MPITIKKLRHFRSDCYDLPDLWENRMAKLLIAAIAALTLAACGGGGVVSPATPTATPDILFSAKAHIGEIVTLALRGGTPPYTAGTLKCSPSNAASLATATEPNSVAIDAQEAGTCTYDYHDATGNLLGLVVAISD
jgi:hypothetical protein